MGMMLLMLFLETPLLAKAVFEHVLVPPKICSTPFCTFWIIDLVTVLTSTLMVPSVQCGDLTTSAIHYHNHSPHSTLFKSLQRHKPANTFKSLQCHKSPNPFTTKNSPADPAKKTDLKKKNKKRIRSRNKNKALLSLLRWRWKC